MQNSIRIPWEHWCN